MNAVETIEQLKPKVQWSRSTVADGKWMQTNTFTPLSACDHALAEFIDNETSARIKADEEEASERQEAIEAEANARQATDDAISAAFDKYVTNTNAWIDSASAKIDTISAYAEGVSAAASAQIYQLSSQISDLENASDVYDIVNSIDDLDGYVGRLTPKAIIKVMSGGENGDVQEYYRWKKNKTASGTWHLDDFEYVCSAQPYYNKVEADAMHQALQNDIDTLSANMDWKVDAHIQQNFTRSEKEQARANIAADYTNWEDDKSLEFDQYYRQIRVNPNLTTVSNPYPYVGSGGVYAKVARLEGFTAPTSVNDKCVHLELEVLDDDELVHGKFIVDFNKYGTSRNYHAWWESAIPLSSGYTFCINKMRIFTNGSGTYEIWVELKSHIPYYKFISFKAVKNILTMNHHTSPRGTDYEIDNWKLQGFQHCVGSLPSTGWTEITNDIFGDPSDNSLQKLIGSTASNLITWTTPNSSMNAPLKVVSAEGGIHIEDVNAQQPTYKYFIAPEATTDDYDKFFGVLQGEHGPVAGWHSPFPAKSSSDAGKSLVVDTDGRLAWKNVPLVIKFGPGTNYMSNDDYAAMTATISHDGDVLIYYQYTWYRYISASSAGYDFSVAGVGGESVLTVSTTSTEEGHALTLKTNYFLPAVGDAASGSSLILDANKTPTWTVEHHVSYDASQGLNTTQQRNARKNISAMTRAQLADYESGVYGEYTVNGCYRCPEEVGWVNVHSTKQYRGITYFTVPAHCTLFVSVNAQLVFNDANQYEWALCIGTSQAVNESNSKYFSNIPNVTNTNLPTMQFSYVNATNSSVTIYLGAYNHSGIDIDGAYLRGNIYNIDGKLYGPTIAYEIRKLVKIKNDE